MNYISKPIEFQFKMSLKYSRLHEYKDISDFLFHINWIQN